MSTNRSASPLEYYLLASQFSLSQFGTYIMDRYYGVFTPSYPGSPSYCTGYDANNSAMLLPGAPDASDPMIAALQQ